jgi:hypothetical protein
LASGASNSRQENGLPLLQKTSIASENFYYNPRP